MSNRRTTPRGITAASDQTPEDERKKLVEEWAAISEQRAALVRIEADLMKRTPKDVPHPPLALPITLTPNVLWGAVVGVLTLVVSVVGSASALYWKAGTHMGDATIHVMETDGVPVMVKRNYEKAESSKSARISLVKDIENKMETQHESLKDDLVKAIAPHRYNRWRAQQKKEKN